MDTRVSTAATAVPAFETREQRITRCIAVLTPLLPRDGGAWHCSQALTELEHYARESREWPLGLLDRVKAAAKRIDENQAPRRIPADPTSDVDLVLGEVRALLEGREPPFWVPRVQESARG